MRVYAIVPQKALVEAKSRLGDVLDVEARAALSLALLETVCAGLRADPRVEHVVVMTPDPKVRAFAAACGLRSTPDPCAGLNEALVEAFRSLPAHSHAILVISADLPLLQPSDVAALCSAGETHRVVLAPSRDAAGTNALLLPPAAAVRPAFGPASLAVHRSRARALGLQVTEVNRPGLAFDLDTPMDLAALWCVDGRVGILASRCADAELGKKIR